MARGVLLRVRRLEAAVAANVKPVPGRPPPPAPAVAPLVLRLAAHPVLWRQFAALAANPSLAAARDLAARLAAAEAHA